MYGVGAPTFTQSSIGAPTFTPKNYSDSFEHFMDKLETTCVLTPCEPMWSARVMQAQRDSVSNQGHV